MVGEVIGTSEAFGAGGAAELAQVHLLVLAQAVLPAELHAARTAFKQLNIDQHCNVRQSLHC